MKPINPIKAASHSCRTSLRKSTRSKRAQTLARRLPRLILALGVAVYASSAAIQAQTWETVDDIPPANAYAITADSTRSIFVAGATKDETGRYHAIITKSSDGQPTWTTSADYPSLNDAFAPNGSAAWFGAIAAADVANGEKHVVAAGRIKRVPFGNTYTGQWLIIRSKDAGTNWVTVDEYSHPTYSQLSSATGPRGVAVDTSGNIYVAGSAEEKIVTVKGKTTTTTTVNHWLIRKGVATADGTMAFTTVGDFAYPVSNEWERGNIYPSGVACVGSNVFVVGGGGGSWHVRKSSDGGTTWPVVDSFRYDQRDTSHAFGIAADSAGNLYVAGLGGRVLQNTSRPYWVVRKGTGGGAGWTTVDQFQYLNGSAQAYAVTVDRNDDVHVTGTAWTASSSLRHWITRQRSAATGAWSTTEDFSMASNGYAQGSAITADPFGNLFAAGAASDSAGVAHNWLVRRKLAP